MRRSVLARVVAFGAWAAVAPAACGGTMEARTDAAAGGSGGTGGGAGTASGGAGAAGGGAGTAGGGGRPGVVTPFEARTPATDCSAVPGAAGGPVVVDSSITCGSAASWNFYTVATGAADRGYLAIGEYGQALARMVTIEPTGAISAVIGPADAPALQVSTDVDGAPYAVSIGTEHDKVGFYRLDDLGWWGEAATRTGGDSIQDTRAVRFARDGRAFVSYYTLDHGVTLATRALDGAWTRAEVGTNSLMYAHTVDRLDRPHVAYLTGDSIDLARIADWVPGSSATSFSFPVRNRQYLSFHAAPVGADGIATTTLFDDGVHVFVQQPDGTTFDLAVPETNALIVQGCPPPPLQLEPAPRSTSCTETGDGVAGLALAATADGLWLLYIWRHVDHDVIQRCWWEQWPLCQLETLADRSASEVVVARVPTNSGQVSAPAVLWRAPLAETPNAWVSMDGRENRLALVTMSVPPNTKSPTLRYVLLDAGAL